MIKNFETPLSELSRDGITQLITTHKRLLFNAFQLANPGILKISAGDRGLRFDDIRVAFMQYLDKLDQMSP